MMKKLKIAADSLVLTIFGLLIWLAIVFVLINILTGCGLVNDWSDPACMTPKEILTGQK